MADYAVYVVCIGTELLLGQTVNTNLAFIGQSLNGAGLMVDRESVIPDTPHVMREVFGKALSEAAVTITVGGLGPTADDLTKEMAAEVVGKPLAVAPEVIEKIRAKYLARSVEPFERACVRQAQMPEGSEPIPNDWGTAPGIWYEHDGHVLVMLPGPPRELRPMFTTYVLPRLRERLGLTELRQDLSVFGTPESTIEKVVMEALAELPEVVPSYSIKSGSCLVRLTAAPDQGGKLTAAAERVLAAFDGKSMVGDVDLAEAVVYLLQQQGWQLGTAESCTGGGIAHRLTDLAGVSSVFKGGVVAYSNELKMALLGVREETLAAHGAVSEETAAEMAAGLAARLGLDAAISVTGIAGPTGGTPDKPVGTVCIGTWVRGDSRVTTSHYRYDRAGVRERTIGTALNQLRQHLMDATL